MDDTRSFHVQWHLTEACTLRCRHCYREAGRRELDAAGRHQVASRLQAFAARRGLRLSVALTGGEPFLVADVYDLAEALAGGHGDVRVSFITNGTVPIETDRLRTLRNLDTVYVSLEGPTPLNDTVRGAGAYAAALRGIGALVRAGLRVGVMTTMMRGTVRELAGTWDAFAAELADAGVAEIILERFVPVGAAAALREEIAPPGDVRALYAAVARQRGADPGMLAGFKALRVILDGSAAGEPDLYGAVCTSGREGCAVLCDGTVYPCRRLPQPLGNALTDPLERLLPDRAPDAIPVADPFGCRAMAHAQSGACSRARCDALV